MEHRGPGFRPHVLEALRRVDRALDLAWCHLRGHWIVVRRAAAAQRAWWNGRWHQGYDIVLRWCGVEGVFRATMPHEKPTFLPLDNRLVLLVRACDVSRRAQASDRWREAEEIDESRESWRHRRRMDRRAEAQAYARSRHELDRQIHVGGMAPAHTNDHDREREVEMSARMRRAMNRVRSGLLPLSRID